MNSGWVRLYRSTIDSDLMKSPMKCHLFNYCLLKASYCERIAVVGNIQVPLKPGQFIFGRHRASEETGITERTIRTCLKHLVKENRLFLANHSTRQFSIVTVCNWEVYQSEGGPNAQPIAQAPTKHRPGTDHSKECIKKDKEGKEKIITPFSPKSGGLDYIADQIDIEQAVKHINRCFEDALKLDNTMISIHSDIRRRQIKKVIHKHGQGKKGVWSLLRIMPKDFVRGWSEFLVVQQSKPENEWSVMFAATAMKRRVAQEEKDQAKFAKAAHEKEVAEAKGPAIALAAKLADEKRIDDEKRDAWWMGLTTPEMLALWEAHEKKYGYAITSEQTVRAWAWEQEKASGA